MQINYLFKIFVVLTGVLLDQYTKHLAQLNISSNNKELIKGILGFSYTENTGIAFSMFKNSSFLLLIITSVFLAVLFFYTFFLSKEKSLLFSFSMLLILSGGIGNWIDRLRYGYVVDFIRVEFFSFPIFNVADCIINVGAILLFIYIIKGSAAKSN